jgi:uncharacterized protein
VKIEQTFEVRAPADTVFAALNDLELVVPCLAGARITGREGDQFHGELQVAFMRLHGTVEITHSDPVAREVHLHTGHHGAVLTVASRDGVADVTASADLSEVGGIALFGGIVQDLSARMLRDFGNCLTHKLQEAA